MILFLGVRWRLLCWGFKSVFIMLLRLFVFRGFWCMGVRICMFFFGCKLKCLGICFVIIVWIMVWIFFGSLCLM